MNSIFTIHPYRANGMWVFDDDAVGLVREPFVGGVPEMIDLMVRDIPNADAGFTLLFSTDPFPEAQVSLEWVRGDMGGNWYRWPEREMEGWLCPALFKYFDTAPPRIHIGVRAAVAKAAGARPSPSAMISVPRSQVALLLELLERGDLPSARAMVAAALRGG